MISKQVCVYVRINVHAHYIKCAVYVLCTCATHVCVIYLPPACIHIFADGTYLHLSLFVSALKILLTPDCGGTLSETYPCLWWDSQ